MADIIRGTSEDLSNGITPLSQAQTIAMGKHLQEEIRNLERKLVEVQRDFQHTREHVDKIKEKASEKREDIHVLQVSLSDTNARLEKVSSEQSRVIESVTFLQASEKETKEKLTTMDERERMFEMRLGVLMQDCAQAKENDKMLQATMERTLDQDIKSLRKEIENSTLRLGQIDNEQKQTAALEKQDREALRRAHSDVENVLNEVRKVSTQTGILETRVATTAKTVVEHFSKVKELEDKTIKIQECYDKTRQRVTDNEGKIKEVRDYAAKTQHDLEDCDRFMAGNKDKIMQHAERLDAQGNACDQLRHDVNGVRGMAEQLSRNLSSLNAQVKDISASTEAVKDGLKETTSLLLPSIGGGEARFGGGGGLGSTRSPSSEQGSDIWSTKF